MRAAWWWLDRWRKSSAYRDLTPEQKGMYRDLLDEVWLREGGVIPDDDRVLGLIVGDPERWKVLRESILSRFRRVKGGWTNDTAQEVMGQAKRRRDNQKAYRDRLHSNNKSDNGADNDRDNDSDNTTDNNPDSPSPSPNVLRTTAVPSLRSGDIQPPVVSVKAPFQAADNPLVAVKRVTADHAAHGEPGEPRRAAVIAPVVAWSREACDDWISRFGGTAPGGQIGKAMKPLVDRHGWLAVRAAWQSYLGQTEAEYASPTRFASTFGRWSGSTVEPAPRDMRAQTPGQFNAATLQRIQRRIEAKEAERDLGQGRIADGPVEARRVLPGETD